jgi:predicted GTPase
MASQEPTLTNPLEDMENELLAYIEIDECFSNLHEMIADMQIKIQQFIDNTTDKYKKRFRITHLKELKHQSYLRKKEREKFEMEGKPIPDELKKRKK